MIRFPVATGVLTGTAIAAFTTLYGRICQLHLTSYLVRFKMVRTKYEKRRKYPMKTNGIAVNSKRRMAGGEAKSWEGHVMGAIVLGAFLLYGVGSQFADEPIGMALVMVNSIVVALAGLIGFRLVRRTNASVGSSYLVARVGEALLLGGGIAIAEFADVSEAGNTGYLLGMIVLGVGSIPFCSVLGVQRWIPQPLAMWGIFGYFILAFGAALELFLERSIAVVFSVPGGLFELAFGVYLIRNGFMETEELEDLYESLENERAKGTEVIEVAERERSRV